MPRIHDHIEERKIAAMSALAFDAKDISAEHALDRISRKKRARIIELCECEYGFEARRFVGKFSAPDIFEKRFVQTVDVDGTPEPLCVIRHPVRKEVLDQRVQPGGHQIVWRRNQAQFCAGAKRTRAISVEKLCGQRSLSLGQIGG